MVSRWSYRSATSVRGGLGSPGLSTRLRLSTDYILRWRFPRGGTTFKSSKWDKVSIEHYWTPYNPMVTWGILHFKRPPPVFVGKKKHEKTTPSKLHWSAQCSPSAEVGLVPTGWKGSCNGPRWTEIMSIEFSWNLNFESFWTSKMIQNGFSKWFEHLN